MVVRRRRSVIEVAKEVSEAQGVLELPVIAGYISTGCTLLDLAITNKLPGGLPLGRISHIYGLEATCKSAIAMAVLGSVQRQGGIAYYADIEQTFDSDFANLFDLDSKNKDIWRLGHPQTIGEFFDEYLDKIMKLDDKRQKVIVVDSLSALPSATELDEKLDEGGFGMSRPKQFSKAFRKYVGNLAKTNTTLVFIDQSRVNINIVFGDKETFSGGKAIRFFSSVRIHLKATKKVKGKYKKVLGQWIDFQVNKNKVAPPFRSGEFLLLFDYGIDDVRSSLEFLKEYQNEKFSRKADKLEFDGQKKTIAGIVRYVEENSLEQKLQKEVEKVWVEIHQTKARKIRVWL